MSWSKYPHFFRAVLIALSILVATTNVRASPPERALSECGLALTRHSNFESDFQVAIELMRLRRPKIRGLAIAERVLYRLIETRDPALAWETRISVGDLDGLLPWMQRELNIMPRFRSGYLKSVHLRLTQELRMVANRGELSYRELLRVSREFSALCEFSRPMSAKMKMRAQDEFKNYYNLHQDAALPEHWQRMVIDEPFESLNEFLSQGRVTIVSHLEFSPQQIASPLTHTVPVQLITRSRIADDTPMSPWGYSWIHDIDHGSVMEGSYPQPFDLSAAYLRKNQETVLPIEAEFYQIAAQYPQFQKSASEVLYETSHERGIPVSWMAMESYLARKVLTNNQSPKQWAELFELTESRGHRNWTQNLIEQGVAINEVLSALELKQPHSNETQRVSVIHILEYLKLQSASKQDLQLLRDRVAQLLPSRPYLLPLLQRINDELSRT